MRKREWEENRRSILYFECSKILTQWKKEKPILNIVYGQVLQEVLVRVDLAYKNFFRRVKRGDKPGYPRFKSFGRYNSITYTQRGFKILDKGLIKLGKIGNVKFKQHRNLQGKIRRLYIKRHGFNKWFISFICEVDDIKPIKRVNQRVIGIDVGLNHFLTQSDGQKKENPRFFRKEEKELRRVHRQFSKTKKGSFERIKKVKVIKRIFERMGNKKDDFYHKASNTIVNKYGIICVEDLKIESMYTKNSGMNKSLNDVSWNMFIGFLEYKAEEAGVQLIKVDPRNTSKTCSRCGCIKDKLGLEDRIYYCLWCGLEIDRDENSAINILRLGLQSVGENP